MTMVSPTHKTINERCIKPPKKVLYSYFPLIFSLTGILKRSNYVIKSLLITFLCKVLILLMIP